MKLIKVEKKKENIVRLFLCCTKRLWVFRPKKKALQTKGRSSDIYSESQSSFKLSRENQATSPIQNLHHMFKNLVELKIKEEDVEISFNVTI